MIHHLHREQFIPSPPAAVWSFFSDPGNLNELTPADMRFEILSGGEAGMYTGQLIEYQIEFVRGVRSRWLTEIAHVRDGRYFVDEQRLGPYRFWYHQHTFEPVEGGVRMTDHVTYAIPFGILGDLLNHLWIRRRLENVFDFRAGKIGDLFGRAV